MSKPIAVLISDVHYNVQNLHLADTAMRMAIDKAAKLKVQLIVAGDMHDTKANLRGECVNAIIKTFQYAEDNKVSCVVLIGNHDLINEKSIAHSLEFLVPQAIVIDEPTAYNGLFFIPYQADPEKFKQWLGLAARGTPVICHQGVHGSDMGEYVQDKSAVHKDIFEGRRVLSGHYHRAQTFKCVDTGVFSYIGTPYTITFAEANDGPKGFQVLYDDGSLEQVSTDLRKHVIREYTTEDIAQGLTGRAEDNSFYTPPGDLVWVKVKGPTLELDKITKNIIAKQTGIEGSFKLDKIPTDTPTKVVENIDKKTNPELFDMLIDSSQESCDSKKALKQLWRHIL